MSEPDHPGEGPRQPQLELLEVLSPEEMAELLPPNSSPRLRA